MSAQLLALPAPRIDANAVFIRDLVSALAAARAGRITLYSLTTEAPDGKRTTVRHRRPVVKRAAKADAAARQTR